MIISLNDVIKLFVSVKNVNATHTVVYDSMHQVYK